METLMETPEYYVYDVFGLYVVTLDYNIQPYQFSTFINVYSSHGISTPANFSSFLTIISRPQDSNSILVASIVTVVYISSQVNITPSTDIPTDGFRRNEGSELRRGSVMSTRQGWSLDVTSVLDKR